MFMIIAFMHGYKRKWRCYMTFEWSELNANQKRQENIKSSLYYFNDKVKKKVCDESLAAHFQSQTVTWLHSKTEEMTVKKVAALLVILTKMLV